MRGLERVLERSPEDLRSMVRMARAHRLLGDKSTSADWYKRAIDGFSENGQGLRALALSKELLSVDPDDHTMLLEMARLYARHPQGERGPGRVATPLVDIEEAASTAGSIPRDFTATSAKALLVLDDAAEVERIEPAVEAAGPAGEEETQDKEPQASSTSSREGAPPASGREPPSPSPALTPDEKGPPPPPPPPEAFIVDDDQDEGDTSRLAADPAWAATSNRQSGDELPKMADHTVAPEPAPPASSEQTTERSHDERPQGPVPPGGQALERAKIGDVPLLSTLGENAFVTLSSEMRPVALGDGEVLFRANDEGRSFFIIAQGHIEAMVPVGGREQVLATLGEGEVLGLFGLYTGRKRNATAIAKGPTVVFEITDRVLARLVKEQPASKKPIALFYRRRLLEISLGRSPLFRDLPRKKRLAIVDRFEQRRLSPRNSVIAPGEVTLGLFLVMRGEVVVSTRDSGRITVKARLGRGQFFGCISALTGMPTLASAECSEESVLAILPHKTFGELLDLEPELSALPGKLRQEGLLITPTLFVGDIDAVSAEAES